LRTDDRHPAFLGWRPLAAAALWLTLTTACFPQETGVPNRPLPADIETTLTGALADLEFERTEVARLDAQLSSTEGVLGDVLARRRDNVWTTLVSDTIAFAKSVADQRDAGADTAAFVDAAVESLGRLPVEAYDALARVRARVVFPTRDLPANEFVVQDQRLFQAIRELDSLYRALIAYTEVAARFDIDTSPEVSFLRESVSETAANRSTFLEKAITDARIVQSASSTLSTDTELAAWLSASRARVRQAASTLQNAIGLMNQLGLETRQYRQQVLTVTGEITADVLDVGIVGGLISEWAKALYDLVATQGPRLVFRAFLVIFVLFAFYQPATRRITGRRHRPDSKCRRQAADRRYLPRGPDRDVWPAGFTRRRSRLRNCLSG
jgi:hypothetical protein